MAQQVKNHSPVRWGSGWTQWLFNGKIKGTSLGREQMPGKMIFKVPSTSVFWCFFFFSKHAETVFTFNTISIFGASHNHPQAWEFPRRILRAHWRCRHPGYGLLREGMQFQPRGKSGGFHTQRFRVPRMLSSLGFSVWQDTQGSVCQGISPT